ncbi:MAG: glycoside hydrolase family 125 protein [Alloprevotella sp.]
MKILPTILLALSAAASPTCYATPVAAPEKPADQRPAKAERAFVSEEVERVITEVAARIKDPKLRQMFINCFPNTLDTTVRFKMKDGAPDTFVITGDIPAMWLRDSSAQLWPYLNLCQADKDLQIMIAGLIRRQADCILLDPYANAFNDGPVGSPWESDFTQHMIKELHERKWEIDSLCYPIRIAFRYWQLTGDASVFTDTWHEAMQLVLRTFREQQRKDGRGPYSFYRECEKATDSNINNGFGAPVRPVGLIFSAFRPSDDATQYGFLVPSNMFAVTSLRQLAEIETKVLHHDGFAQECRALADEVETALQKYAVVEHPKYGKIYAYEVDGYGNYAMMDDANVPSLLALPYMGWGTADDSIYRNTRRFVWSEDNPYFFRGKAGEGIGGPHVGLDYPWPMSLILKGLTADSADEQYECLTMLRNTDGGTGFMHESFHKDDARNFTRSWFAWANTLFGELVLHVADTHPEVLQRDFR